MTKFRVKAVAPTAYQYQSVSHFGKPIGNLNGTFVFEQDFETREDAEHYLEERAMVYFDAEEELGEALETIHTSGILRMDAVAGNIEEVLEDTEAI